MEYSERDFHGLDDRFNAGPRRNGLDVEDGFAAILPSELAEDEAVFVDFWSAQFVINDRIPSRWWPMTARERSACTPVSPRQERMMLAVEVGGSSVQAVWFDDAGRSSIVSLDDHKDEPWLLAAPGLVQGDRVLGAHHLGWMDANASEELHMRTPPVLGMNDADAAALGEWTLRGCPPGTLLYVSMGTGTGATAVNDGSIIPVEFGHLTAFGPNRCDGCGRTGCLDAQIGGHALPTPLSDEDIAQVVTLLSAALDKQEIAVDRIIVGGGLPRRYPRIVKGLDLHRDRPVEPSASPPGFKSAAPFGLLHKWTIGTRSNQGPG